MVSQTQDVRHSLGQRTGFLQQITWGVGGTHELKEFKKKEKKNLRDTATSNTREDSTHGHHQMVNTEIRLIIFFAAKEGEALHSQQKQDRGLTVAQIMNSLLPNSDLN